MATLQQITLKGFKSIKSTNLELRELNVLIGANGAGKSNLISFFKMLNEMMGNRFQEYVETNGFARSFLHFGPKVTQQIEARLDWSVDNGVDTYGMRLAYAVGDRLVFVEEVASFHQTGYPQPIETPLHSPSRETLINDAANAGDPRAKAVRYLLNNTRVYHFHDTSRTARVRGTGFIGDNRWLMPDAGNLAAFLFRLQQDNGGTVYQRIIKTIQLIAPYFDDFVLEPEGPSKKDILLNWRDKGSDQVFGPHQLSDGTLRAMCLVSLLMQPEEEFPRLIIVDEPELGLHPYALSVIASLFQKASHHTQVLISTQSTSLLDSFEPEDIIVVNREGKESLFTRPDAAKLKAWLDEYSLGEIWEKNVIGGGPH